MKTITKIIIETDDEGNMFFNGDFIPPSVLNPVPPLLNNNSSIPPACRSCSNHPSNGGSGICHCILGQPQITW